MKPPTGESVKPPCTEEAVKLPCTEDAVKPPFTGEAVQLPCTGEPVKLAPVKLAPVKLTHVKLAPVKQDIPNSQPDMSQVKPTSSSLTAGFRYNSSFHSLSQLEMWEEGG